MPLPCVVAAALALVLLTPFGAAGQGQQGPSFQELEESLTCQCGCGLTVHSCNHLTCPSAIPLRAEIREQMALGKGKAEILDHFRQTYGELILSSPTTRGFNLLAWVLPFVAVAVGLFFIVFVVRRWVTVQQSRRAANATTPIADSPAVSSQYQARFEKELRELDR